MSDLKERMRPRELTKLERLSLDLHAHANGEYGWTDLRAYSDEDVRANLALLLRCMTSAQFAQFVNRSQAVAGGARGDGGVKERMRELDARVQQAWQMLDAGEDLATIREALERVGEAAGEATRATGRDLR